MKFSDISLSLKSGRKIVEHLTFTLSKRDKLAIIGEEGNGKSTLIKFIYDKNLIEDYCLYRGNVEISKENIGYLEQSLNINWYSFGAMDYLITNEFNEFPQYERLNQIYEIETLFKTFKLDLNILDENRKLNILSGGEKLKLQFIKILFNTPDLILLDEPTNDIDLEALKLFEEFIVKISIPIIYVSHDETLLSHTANIILHLEQIKRKTEMKFTLVKMDYSSYISQRTKQLEQQNRDAYRTRKEKEEKKQNLMHQHLLVENDLDRAVRNPTAGRLLAKKMKNIKSMEKKLDRMPIIDYAQPEEAINAFFNPSTIFPNGKTGIELQNYTLQIGNCILAEKINFKIVGPKHICIIGKNGCGKTTLLKHIYKQMNQKTEIKIGYMPQEYEDELNLEISPVSYLQKELGYDTSTKAKIMSSLGAMNFQEFEMGSKIKELSGGQKAKLFFVKLILTEKNVLLLDEPTRNLSPLSNPVIRSILKDYKGAIICVTHDRKLLEEMADEIYELDLDGLHQRNSPIS